MIEDYIIQKIGKYRKSKNKIINATINKKSSNTSLFFIHGWGSSSRVFNYLVNKFEYSTICIDYPKEVLSSDTQKTLNSFKKIKALIQDVKSKVNAKKNYVIGISLGGHLAMYCSSLFDKAVVSVTGSMISEGVWSSIATTMIKDKLIEKGYNLKKLKEKWREIEPINNISDINYLVYYSKTDLVIRSYLQKQLIDKMKNAQVIESIFGHYVVSVKTMLDYPNIKKFFSDECLN